MHKIEGHWATHDIYFDGKRIDLSKGLEIISHSPSGFNWGYGGSGPAQTAFGILNEILPPHQAISLHQDFKWEFIALMAQGEDFVLEIDIEKWAKEKSSAIEKLNNKPYPPGARYGFLKRENLKKS